MRWNIPRLLAGWWLVAVACGLGATTTAAGEPQDRMAAIVAALRVEEARYADVEYVARITTRQPDPKDPANTTDVTSMATRRVVLQWDRISFRSDSFDRTPGAKVHREEVSAYDGERTVTVIAGNCVNIHLGGSSIRTSRPCTVCRCARSDQRPAVGVSERDRGDPRRPQVSPVRPREQARSTSSPGSKRISRARKRSTASAA